jgi:signal transduction histidine kinase
VAVVIRTVALEAIRPRLPIYLSLELVYLVLYVWMFWRSFQRHIWRHAYLILQSLLVLSLISLRPQFDFINILFILLSYQTALLFSGRARWIWIAILVLLTCLPLIIALGVIRGLAIVLLPVMVVIVFPAYVAVTQEIEAGHRSRQALLDELQAANQQLTVSASQVEELTAIAERNRLARELHDSVSQTVFSISLHTRSARILLERDPARLRPQLEQLRALTQNALEEMRGLIANLRPQENDSAERPTP